MRNNNILADEIAKAGHQPHCLQSLECEKFFGGCENCRRFDGVQIEEYDENSVIVPIGFYKPEHSSINESYYI